MQSVSYASYLGQINKIQKGNLAILPSCMEVSYGTWFFVAKPTNQFC